MEMLITLNGLMVFKINNGQGHFDHHCNKLADYNPQKCSHRYCFVAFDIFC
jgi:hypothetical protein